MTGLCASRSMKWERLKQKEMIEPPTNLWLDCVIWRGWRAQISTISIKKKLRGGLHSINKNMDPRNHGSGDF